MLVPSGEGDCSSFERLAARLADRFSVLTFDTPCFSRSQVRSAETISVPRLADQIAELIKSMQTHPATFWGCSSGGLAVLDLVVRHTALVRNAIVHEVVMDGAVAMLGDLATVNDAEVVERCTFLFAHIFNDDLAAWQALGDEYHARLATNYVTWVRQYVAPGLMSRHNPKGLAGKPITWTIGGLTPAAAFLDNVVLAVESGIPISALTCKHFPQVSAPDMLAEHIQTSTLPYLQ